MFKEFALKDVKPNPFRDYVRNPIQPAKVTALVDSINATGFWENIEGRIVGAKLEIAYGHHRLEALRKIDPPVPHRRFIVRNLSDSQMLQRMGCENSSTYSSDLGTVIESVRATVAQFAEGSVTLDAVPEKTKHSSIRYAPSFVAGVGADSLEHPYTALSIARFLCCTYRKGTEPQAKIVAALAVLELEEMKIWDAERIYTFRRPDGTIPVEFVWQETKNSKTRAELTRMREAAKAEQAKRDAEPILERLRRAEQEQKRKQAENDRLLRAHLEIIRMGEEEKIAQIIADRKENEQKRVDAEARRKKAEKEWKANEKARKDSIEAQRKAVIEKAKRIEAQRASRVKTVTQQIDVILSDADALYADLKSLRTNRAEDEQVRKALDNASLRCAKAKRLLPR